MILDPNSPEIDRKPRFQPRDGKKTFAVTRYKRGTNDAGETTFEVGLVVLKDYEPADPKLDPSSDEGLCLTTKFTINERQGRWLALFARELGYHQKFDPLDVTEDDKGHTPIDKVFASNKGILTGTIVTKTGTRDPSKTFANAGNFVPADNKALGFLLESGDLNPDILALISGGEEEFDRMIAARAKYAAGGPRPSGGARASGGGGQPAIDDSDIPF